MKQFNVISLFSGCGGLDLGFTGGFSYLNKNYKKNGFNIVFANDIVKAACDTYNANFDHKCLLGDIKDFTFESYNNIDVVIGGFPCQDFSLAGLRNGFLNDRGNLYKQMSRVIKETKPKIFLAENVEGLLIEIDGVKPIDIILKEFQSNGYKVKYQLFNTADFEVPQTRKRVIIVGVRNDIIEDYNFPIKFSKKWISVKTAIDDLRTRLDDPNIYNHTSKDYSKAKFNPSGKGQGNRRLNPDIPSITIRSEHHGNIEGHYRTNGDESDCKNWRRLSVRECARIQSFPDSFRFESKASAAYKLVGNAVPPVFARHLAKSIRGFLETYDKSKH